MSNQESALNWFTGGSEDDEEEEDASPSEDVEADESGPHESLLAPEEHRGGEGCCPWCLGQAEDFVERPTCVGCGHCDSAIPIGVDWYEAGKKIVV